MSTTVNLAVASVRRVSRIALPGVRVLLFARIVLVRRPVPPGSGNASGRRLRDLPPTPEELTREQGNTNWHMSELALGSLNGLSQNKKRKRDWPRGLAIIDQRDGKFAPL